MLQSSPTSGRGCGSGEMAQTSLRPRMQYSLSVSHTSALRSTDCACRGEPLLALFASHQVNRKHVEANEPDYAHLEQCAEKSLRQMSQSHELRPV